MNIRKLVIGMILWGAIAMVLASKGILASDWQFWAVFVLAFLDSLNDRP